MPVAVYMSPNNQTPHLIGYTGEWSHYVVGSGYGSYGDTTTYDDPFETGYGSLGRHSGFANADMVYMLSSFGLIW